MYLVNTRPDINFAVNSLSQFMVDPRRVHWTTAKHILCYIRGTMEYGLVYKRRGSVQLAGFIDAGWAGSVEDRRVLQVVVSVLDQGLSLGSAGSRSPLH